MKTSLLVLAIIMLFSICGLSKNKVVKGVLGSAGVGLLILAISGVLG
jgi:hypothetical protein